MTIVKKLEIAQADQRILAMNAPLFCHVCQEHKDREEFNESGTCYECLDGEKPNDQ